MPFSHFIQVHVGINLKLVNVTNESTFGEPPPQPLGWPQGFQRQPEAQDGAAT